MTPGLTLILPESAFAGRGRTTLLLPALICWLRGTFDEYSWFSAVTKKTEIVVSPGASRSMTRDIGPPEEFLNFGRIIIVY